MTEFDRYFIDTNTLVYSAIAESPLHQKAAATIAQLWTANAELWISRQILREYIAALTRPNAFGVGEAIPLVTALSDVKDFQDAFSIAEDGPDVTRHLLELLEKIPSRGKQIHDANIVATMLSHGITRLLTHNVKDFDRYKDIITIMPLSDAT